MVHYRTINRIGQVIILVIFKIFQQDFAKPCQANPFNSLKCKVDMFIYRQREGAGIPRQSWAGKAQHQGIALCINNTIGFVLFTS